MNDILMRLTDLGVLTTERRIKRRRVLNEIRAGLNEIRIDENVDTFFKPVFDEQNEQHIYCYRAIKLFTQEKYLGATVTKLH